MKNKAAKHLAIIDLHERGYFEDFQLLGNDLFWSQGKKTIRAGEFAILEEHIITDVGPVKKC